MDCQLGHFNHHSCVMKYIYGTDDGISGAHLREIDFLRRCHHPHIVHALAVMVDSTRVSVVLPLSDRNFFDVIMDPNVTTSMLIEPLYKIIQGIAFAHKHGFLHLNIKTSNIVFQLDHTPHLIGWDLNLEMDDGTLETVDTKLRVTLDHRPPEILRAQIEGTSYVYTPEVDIWSLGILMIYAFTGAGIYNVNWSELTPAAFLEIMESMWSHPTTIPRLLTGMQNESLATDLIQSILEVDPTARATLRQILDHPLFHTLQEGDPGYVEIPPIIPEYGESHRDILKLMVQCAKNAFPTSEVRCLFLGIDIYNRTAHAYQDKTPLDQMKLAFGALWIAHKYVTLPSGSMEAYIDAVQQYVPEIDRNDILQAERDIINITTGILNVNALYNVCQNGDDLDQAYAQIIMHSDPTTYAQTDFIAWKTQLGETPSSTKHIKIEEFL